MERLCLCLSCAGEEGGEKFDLQKSSLIRGKLVCSRKRGRESTVSLFDRHKMVFGAIPFSQSIHMYVPAVVVSICYLLLLTNAETPSVHM